MYDSPVPYGSTNDPLATRPKAGQPLQGAQGRRLASHDRLYRAPEWGCILH
jgi:hypothetical protein